MYACICHAVTDRELDSVITTGATSEERSREPAALAPGVAAAWTGSVTGSSSWGSPAGAPR